MASSAEAANAFPNFLYYKLLRCPITCFYGHLGTLFDTSLSRPSTMAYAIPRGIWGQGYSELGQDIGTMGGYLYILRICICERRLGR